MAARILVIGNRNYSSWSLRPWLFMKQNGIAFEEVCVPLYQASSKERLLRYSPSGKVPALRQNLSMNVRKVFAPRTWPAEVGAEIERIESLWQSCRRRHGTGGPFLFGRFCAADAMYAPVVWRFIGYSVPLAPAARAYCDAMLALRPRAIPASAARAEAETLPQFEMAP